MWNNEKIPWVGYLNFVEASVQRRPTLERKGPTETQHILNPM